MPDPLVFRGPGLEKIGSLAESVPTAGCMSIAPARRVTEDPSKVTCHRCRLYLREHPQYVAFLNARLVAAARQEAWDAAARVDDQVAADCATARAPRAAS